MDEMICRFYTKTVKISVAVDIAELVMIWNISILLCLCVSQFVAWINLANAVVSHRRCLRESPVIDL